MTEDAYYKEIFNNLGIAISEKNNQEILYKMPIFYEKKLNKYVQSDDYIVTNNDTGTFMAEFLNTDFNVLSEFSTFFNQYHLLILNGVTRKRFLNTSEYTQEEYDNFINLVMKEYSKELIKLQSDIDMILDYCVTDPNKRTKKLTPFERLCILENIPGSPNLLYSNKIERITLNAFTNMSKIQDSEEKNICTLLSKSKIKATCFLNYLPKDLPSLLYFELVEALKGNIALRNCKLCDKYFISRIYKVYCNNIYKDTNKTCTEIGKQKLFAESIKNDNALALYKKVYHAKAYKVSRYKNDPILLKDYISDFEEFKKQGKRKVQQYKLKTFSKQDFIDWIMQNM